MGVRCLARTNAPVAAVEERVSALGATAFGRWRVACTYLLPRAAGTHLREIYDVHFFAEQSSSGGSSSMAAAG